MKLHRNAKSTPASRLAMVRRVLVDGWPYAAVAEGFAVSVRTVAKWVRRFRAGRHRCAGGRPVAAQRARRAKRARNSVDLIRALREAAWAPGVGDQPRPPGAAVDGERLAATARVGPAAGRPAAPGAALRMGRPRRSAASGHQAARALSIRWVIGSTGIAGSPRRGRAGSTCTSPSTTTAGSPMWKSWARQDGETCAAFLASCGRLVRRQGIRCRRLLSDNGSGYVSRAFQAARRLLQLRHLRTRPYTPRTNGKAERVIQTLLREWAYVQPYATSHDRRRALRPCAALLQSPASARQPGLPLADYSRPDRCVMNNVLDLNT